MKKALRLVLIGIPIVLLMVVAGFVIWANNPLPATAEALAALEPDAEVNVTSLNGWTAFTPAGTTPTTGFIFYPGGRVDARAYAPPLRQIAAQGYLTVLVPMPLNLAVFDLSAADRVRAAFPDIQQWAIGGHSLGGAMAARYVQSQPGAKSGLVFWASFPDIDLSGESLAIVSIYGTLDGLATVASVEGSRARLPATTQFVPIEGGNHSQFGWYGDQPGDNPAGITHTEQQAQVVAATVSLLEAIRR
jgi:pimeloyl-ACP methyl ester carboxylesterase